MSGEQQRYMVELPVAEWMLPRVEDKSVGGAVPSSPSPVSAPASTPTSVSAAAAQAQASPQAPAPAASTAAQPTDGETKEGVESLKGKVFWADDSLPDMTTSPQTGLPKPPTTWQEGVKAHFTSKPESEETENKFGNMQDVIDYLEERKAAIHIPTKEELEKERRRKKTEGIISAIADGASAISNLIATTQYAPDMYRHENSLSEKMKERYDKLKAEREADADRYLNYALTIGKLKDAEAERRYKHGRDALADRIRVAQEERAQAKADRDAAMQALKAQLMLGKISEQDAQAKAAQIEAEYAERFWQAKLGVLTSQKGKNDAQAYRARHPAVRSGGGKSGGGGGGGQWSAVDSDGNIHYFSAKSLNQAHSYCAGRDWQLLTSYTETSSDVNNTSSSKDPYGQETTNTTNRSTTTRSHSRTMTPGGKGRGY